MTTLLPFTAFQSCGSGLPLQRLSDTNCQNKMLMSCSISHKPNTRISMLAIPCIISITSNGRARQPTPLKEASPLPITVYHSINHNREEPTPNWPYQGLKTKVTYQRGLPRTIVFSLAISSQFLPRRP